MELSNFIRVMWSSVTVIRPCVSLPCLLVRFAGVKEPQWDKGGCFALIIGDTDRKIFLTSVTEGKIFLTSVTESLLRPPQHFWKQELTRGFFFR